MRAIIYSLLIISFTSTFAASSIPDASLPINAESMSSTAVTDPNTSFNINEPIQQQPLCEQRYLGAVEDVEFLTPGAFTIKSRVGCSATTCPDN